MKQLLHPETVAEMIEVACRLIHEKGIMTRNNQLLEATRRHSELSVRGSRIFPSPECIQHAIDHLRTNTISPVPGKYINQHGWPDMLIDQDSDNDWIIKFTDLPYQYCNHRERSIVPLTRQHVIQGTKLLHVLGAQKDIKGYSCGVPQDTANELKSVEQYIIGFRYNAQGGATIQAVSEQVEGTLAQIRAIAENREDSNERELMLFSPSPLILDADDLYLCFKPGVTIRRFMIGSMPMMGMTGPVDPVGSYTLGLAEVLGGAAILHALLPEAKAYIYPHPQAMDLRSGMMAFGTVEHARLEMLKKQIMSEFGLRYYNLKDLMTSAQMPGAMAQGDKALGFYTGMMAGFRAFNLMPLSTDQVWSPVQALLDIDAIHNAISATRELHIPDAVQNAEATVSEAIDNDSLFAEATDTLMNMFENYETDLLHNRFFSSETWQSAGQPDEWKAVEEKCDELQGAWNYRPDQQKIEKISDIYRDLCERYNTNPIDID